MSASTLLESLKNKLRWEWDDRFEGILATFDAQDQEDMSRILGDHLGQRWDSNSAADAPPAVAQALKAVGGVAPGQLVYSSDPTQPLIVLALWWPWNNGTTISIRIIPTAVKAGNDALQAEYALLRTYC